MLKFVILSALMCLAVAAPTPGFLHGGYALPAATSYSSRVDLIHSTPIIKTYAAPAIVATPVVAKTISYAAPVVASYGGHGYGLGLDHGYGYGHGWL